jgi:uncharacterized protein (DUF1330 family)
MTAYVISEIARIDPDLIQGYRELAAPSIAAFGGRFLVRGGAVESVEGDWKPNGIVMLAFPDMAAARAWYASPDYAEALALSRRALSRRLLFVEGL